MKSALPRLCVLLMHLSACDEAMRWAGKREINAAVLAECPKPEWRRWICGSLGVAYGSGFESLKGAALAALSGSGSGYGSGYGDGSGSWSGYGYGYGSGDGDGSGSGYGYGYGSGDGDGSGSGYGYGSGSGDVVAKA